MTGNLTKKIPYCNNFDEIAVFIGLSLNNLFIRIEDRNDKGTKTAGRIEVLRIFRIMSVQMKSHVYKIIGDLSKGLEK